MATDWSLFQMAPFSPSPTGANATSSMLPFNTVPASSPVNPATPVVAPAPSSNKWMVISLLGALAFGMWYMGGGFGLGTGTTSAAPAKRRGRGRRKASRARSSRRRSGGRRRSRSRKKVTFGW